MRGDTGLALSHIEILAASSGAPRAFVSGQPASCSVSLSHSGGVALVTLGTSGARQGCDLEVVEVRPASFELDYFTSGELDILNTPPRLSRALAVTIVWCLKESALKALEEGLRMDTRAAEVTHIEQPEGSNAWARASVHCPDTKRRFYGWWRVESGRVAAVTVEMVETTETADDSGDAARATPPTPLPC